LAEGWRLQRLTPISCLYGANGLRTGADGRIYAAQCIGSQISAVDIETGALEAISAQGGDIVAPDDLDFDAFGNIYATEVMDARVSVREPNGRTRVLHGDLPSANGITFHQGRLFIDECRPGGRLLELDLDGGAPRVVAEDLPLPNALAPGPDGWLYFPLVVADEIWRVHPDGGTPERVVAGLSHPVAVKFDPKGCIVAPQSGTGEVLRIDPRTGDRTVLARLDPGLDNLTFVGERLFVSQLTDGRITEVLAGGGRREVLPGGFQFPLDLSLGEDGRLYVSDNTTLYGLRPGERPQVAGRLFAPGFPGTIRGVAALGGGAFALTTTDGRLAVYRPADQTHEVWAEGHDQLYAAAAAPDGSVVTAEYGAGRVLRAGPGGTEELARGLAGPTGVVADAEGGCYVSESAGGRVVRLAGGGAETVLDGLQQPQGIALCGGRLYVSAPPPNPWSSRISKAAAGARSPQACRWGRRPASHPSR
jgi:sugar lactone lactonase YvrE